MKTSINFHQPYRPIGLAILALALASLPLSCVQPHQQAADALRQQSIQASRGPKPIPNYPAQAETNGWEGTVVLRLVIGSDCKASSVEVAQSSGHGILDDTARDSVSKWTFRPDEIGTNPVEIPIRFQLFK
jgi:protein TonB